MSKTLADLIGLSIDAGIEPRLAAQFLPEAFELGLTKASTLSVDKSSDVRGGPLVSTAEQDRRNRDAARKRAKRAEEAAAKLAAKTSADVPALSEDVSLSPCDSSSLLSLEVSPKRKKENGVRARGTRLSADAQLSDEDRAFAVQHGLNADASWVEFRDFWIGVPGSRGVKLDWPATWRNRVRDLAGKMRGRGRGPPGNSFSELHRDLLNSNGGHHESPGLAEFDGPQFDLTPNDSHR